VQIRDSINRTGESVVQYVQEEYSSIVQLVNRAERCNWWCVVAFPAGPDGIITITAPPSRKHGGRATSATVAQTNVAAPYYSTCTQYSTVKDYDVCEQVVQKSPHLVGGHDVAVSAITQ